MWEKSSEETSNHNLLNASRSRDNFRARVNQFSVFARHLSCVFPFICICMCVSSHTTFFVFMYRINESKNCDGINLMRHTGAGKQNVRTCLKRTKAKR